MKRWIAVASTVVMMSATAQADLLVAWEFSGLSGINADPQLASSAADNMAEDDMFASRGDGLVASSNTGGYAANNWHSDTPSLANAISSNNYFQFTLSAESGYTFTVTNIVWNMRRSGTGPDEFVLRSSADGYANDLATWSQTANATGLDAALNLSAASDVTFRLYGYGTTSSAGSMNLGGTGDDVQFWGEVIPEPGTMGLLGIGLLGVAALRRRKLHA